MTQNLRGKILTNDQILILTKLIIRKFDKSLAIHQNFPCQNLVPINAIQYNSPIGT